jgi:uncharacterized membrane protein
MDDKDAETQARAIVGQGLSRELGQSRATVEISNRPAGRFRFELVSHRSLGATGFMILMVAVLLINVVVGGVFYSLGAWPVLAFCGLDVALVYWAFKANYRAGRLSETIDVTPAMMTLTRRLPTGNREQYEFNPYWVRVRLYEKLDGRNELRLASHGEEFMFAKFLSDDERRDFAECLTGALLAARSVRVT